MTTLADQLRKYLQTNWAWHSKGRLTAEMQWKHVGGKSRGARYLPETVGRALRALEEGSIIAVKQDGISVQYKWLDHSRRKSYIPFSVRPDNRKNTLFKS